MAIRQDSYANDNLLSSLQDVEVSGGRLQCEETSPGVFEPAGQATSVDLVSGYNATGINELSYTLARKPGDSLGRLSYSDDGSMFRNLAGDTTSGAEAASFDGVNDYIDTNKIISAVMSAGTGSMACWVKLDSNTPPSHATNCYQGYGILGDTGAFMGLYQTNVASTGNRLWAYSWDGAEKRVGFPCVASRWYHVAWVHGSGTLSLYVDGVLAGAVSAGNITALVTNIRIGRAFTTSAQYFPGKIDDVRIYTVALSATEVWDLFANGVDAQSGSGVRKIWYKLDGNANDSSGNGNNGTNNGATFVNGFSNVAPFGDITEDELSTLKFDGVDDFVSNATANFRSSDSAGTIQAWIWLGAGGAAQTILASADESSTTRYLALEVNSSDRLAIRQNDNGTASNITGGTTLKAGCWHHVAVVSSGTAYSLYLNGVAESLTVSSGSNDGDWFADTSARDNFTVGALKTTSSSNFFQGRIANLAVYSAALSGGTIGADFINGWPSGSSLVLEYRFDEGTGSTADNAEGTSALDGTISGAAWINDAYRPIPTTPTQQTLNLASLAYTDEFHYRLQLAAGTDRTFALNETTLEFDAPYVLLVLDGDTSLPAGTGQVDFGTVLRGRSRQKTLTVSNTGASSIDISAIRLPTGYEFDTSSDLDGSGGTLTAVTSATLVINLVTHEVAARSGFLIIESDDPVSPEYVVSLTGNVIDAEKAVQALFDEPSTLVSLVGYDSRSNSVLAVDPKLNTSITVFDGAGRAVQSQQHLRRNGQGHLPTAAGQTMLPFGGGCVTTSTRYDANGRVVELVDDRGSATRYEYDSLDRRTRMIFHDNATRQYEYDEAGGVAVYTDENGSELENTIDPLGRKIQCDITAASGVIGTNQQTAQFDGMSRVTYSRDSISTDHADAQLTYDSLGRVIEDYQAFDGNTRVTVNEKFHSNTIKQFKFPDGRQITNSYDDLYRRTQVSEVGGSAIADWQFFGPARVAEVKLAAAESGANLYCTFMNNSRTRSAIQSGLETPAWGDLSSERLGYDAVSRPIAKRYLLTALDPSYGYSSTSAVIGQTTAYDRASNKLYERALHAENRSHLYDSTPPLPLGEGAWGEGGEGVVGYDSRNRLRQYKRGMLSEGGTRIVSPITLPNTSQSRTYDLDGLGNWRRTTFEPVGGAFITEVRQHNGLNQITSTTEGDDPKVLSTYDANGNLLNDGTRAYEWDALNRLKKVYKTPASPVLIAEYTYDALGRRIRKVVTSNGLSGSIPNGTIDFLYHSRMAQCCEERDAGNDPSKQYVWGIYVDELIQQKNLVALNNFSADALLYPVQDTLYRTTALIDGAGVVREAYDCDAYGNTLILRESGAPPSATDWTDNGTQVAMSTCEFIFTGRRYDSETEMYFYRARYYDPVRGAFIGRDPIGIVSGEINLYAYANCAPGIYVDPSGLFWGLAIDAVAVVLFVAIVVVAVIAVVVAIKKPEADFIPRIRPKTEEVPKPEEVNPPPPPPQVDKPLRTCATEKPGMPLCADIGTKGYWEGTIKGMCKYCNDDCEMNVGERKPVSDSYDCPGADVVGPYATHYACKHRSPRTGHGTSVMSCRCCKEVGDRVEVETMYKCAFSS